MANKLDPATRIPARGDVSVADFWSWAYSDLLSNINRSRFAEFVVAVALDVADQPRVEWDAVDIRYQGKTIEVKSAAFLQSWTQERPSTIQFDIARKVAWDAETNTYSDEAIRAADCFVFCLYAETDRDRADVLDLDSWEFYVLSTKRIDTELGDQKSVGISRVKALCYVTSYRDLKSQIEAVLRREQ